jgi:hypothetical protein
MNKNLEVAAAEYLKHIKADYVKYSNLDAITDPISRQIREESIANFQLSLMEGSKYIRVVAANGSSRSVHSFLDLDGNIWKAAGWKAPALNHTRGNVFKPETWSGITWTGPQYLR